MINKNLDKTTNEFLEKLNKYPSLQEMGVKNARKFLTDSQKSVKYDMSGVTVEYLDNMFDVPCYKISPENNKVTNKYIIFIHGGGSSLSHYADYERMVRDIVVQSGTPCIFVEYSLSPESKYPVQLEQCFGVCEKLHKEGKKFALVGNSFGGGLVIGLYDWLYQEGIPVECIVSMWPMCDSPYAHDTYEKYGKGRYLLGSDMLFFWNNYISVRTDYDMPDVTPAENDSDWFSIFPPTLIQIMEEDPLRGEGTELFRKMMNAGVDVTGCLYLGSIHDMSFLNQLANTNYAKKILEDCCIFLKKHLTIT